MELLIEEIVRMQTVNTMFFGLFTVCLCETVSFKELCDNELLSCAALGQPSSQSQVAAHSWQQRPTLTDERYFQIKIRI